MTDGNPKIDSLTLFYNVLNRIEKIEEGKTINCIIIDGLSKLSANDIEQINFQALTESLKKMQDCHNYRRQQAPRLKNWNGYCH